MKVYFLSSRPCALTLNDAYFGLTDRFERFAEISLKDNFFVRFTPENAQPIGFFLNESIRFTPPVGCEVYLLDNALAIYAKDFPPSDLALKLLTQKRFEKTLITLFYQGELHLSIETENDFFISTLPPAFEKSELVFENGAFVLKAPNAVAVFTKTGEKVLMEETLSCTVETGVLHATLPLSDSLGRVADCAWEISEKGVRRTKCTLSQSRAKNGENDPETIKTELLPFAFFESVLLRADYACMLSDDLAPQADKLKGYLGDYRSVTLTDDPNTCGLVYQKSERIFEIVRYTVTVENGKIADIRR